ncbi:MAG: transporter substrate-binding domain-containing protein [Oscillospiraceae bacterium]|nr:transporter substrate-binding domain-containing protein [Oscillospiraceae bacterium]
MKKILFRSLAFMLLTLLVFSLVSCGKSKKNKLICGITDFEPMNYIENGKWVGFDTEFAILVSEKLGMEVEFQEIEWGSKYQELDAGTINCIWNGFTANADESDGTKRSDLVDFSYSYMINQQSVVIKSERAGEFKSIDDLVGKTAAAEAGSAGESFAQDAVGSSGNVLGSAAQINTLLEVKAGAVDCAVIDVLLARRLAGSGDYSDLAIANIELESEVYAVGFKKGSDLRDKVNKAIKELYDDGSLMKLAEKYGLENTLEVDTNYKG